MRHTVEGMNDEIAPRDIRVSHAERDHVTQLLAAHFAEGRLTTDEYGERSEAAAGAVVRSDLNRLLADLPGADVGHPREVLELVNVGGDHRRHGEWTVPPRIVVRSRFGNAYLDFRSARFTTPVVTVEVEIGLGNVDLRLPKGATVDLDDARTGFGQVTDRTGPTAGRGNPHVVVRGRTVFGLISARH